MYDKIYVTFVLKVLLNPTNAKFQVASSSSFPWGTQSSSVLNLLPSTPYLCTTSANRNSQWMIHNSTISALDLPSTVPIKSFSPNTNIPLVDLLLLLPSSWVVFLKTRMSKIKQVKHLPLSQLSISSSNHSGLYHFLPVMQITTWITFSTQIVSQIPIMCQFNGFVLHNLSMI